MYRLSRALEIMVAKEAATAHFARAIPIAPAKLERILRGELSELQRSRPRLVEFAPRTTPQRVLAQPRLCVRMIVTDPGLAMP